MDIDGPFNGAIELSKKLATSSEVRECMAKQWFRFALGRGETENDNCSVKAAYDASRRLSTTCASCSPRSSPPTRSATAARASNERHDHENDGHPFNPRNSRRAFLRGLGVAAGLSPFIPLLNASAQESVFPKRLILFYTPHGTVLDQWKPVGTETNFTFGRILAPLEKHKSKLVVINGLSIPDNGVGAPHTKGPALLWTGSTLLDDGTFIRSDGSGGPTYGWNSAAVDRSDHRQHHRNQDRLQVARVRAALRREHAAKSHDLHRAEAAASAAPRSVCRVRAALRQFAQLGWQPMIDKLTAQRRSSIDIVKAELDGRARADRPRIARRSTPTSGRCEPSRRTSSPRWAPRAPLRCLATSSNPRRSPHADDYVRGIDVMVVRGVLHDPREASTPGRRQRRHPYIWMNSRSITAPRTRAAAMLRPKIR